MTLTPSDVASLTASLSRWELGEYVCAGLVTIACVGEYTATFKNWFTGGVKEQKERLEKLSTLLLIVGLAIELVCLVRTNQISGKVIGSLNYLAEEASAKSQKALTDADVAIGKARIAVEESGNAKVQSSAAKESASHAGILARGARQEADSFEKDIASAKEQAASAESDLADALRQSSAAQLELNRIKEPRSLTDVPSLVATLKAFAGTEYTFSGVGVDDDSENLVVAIDKVLYNAGWKRGKPIREIPLLSFKILGSPQGGFSIPEATTSGIRISIESPKDVSVLKLKPVSELPMYIRAAGSLWLNIVSRLSPPEEHPKSIIIDKGSSKTVKISVGAKL